MNNFYKFSNTIFIKISYKFSFIIIIRETSSDILINPSFGASVDDSSTTSRINAAAAADVKGAGKNGSNANTLLKQIANRKREEDENDYHPHLIPRQGNQHKTSPRGDDDANKRMILQQPKEDHSNQRILHQPKKDDATITPTMRAAPDDGDGDAAAAAATSSLIMNNNKPTGKLYPLHHQQTTKQVATTRAIAEEEEEEEEEKG